MLGLNPQLEQHLYDHGDERHDFLHKTSVQTQHHVASTTTQKKEPKDKKALVSTDALFGNRPTLNMYVLVISGCLIGFIIGRFCSNYERLENASCYQPHGWIRYAAVCLAVLFVWKYFDSKTKRKDAAISSDYRNMLCKQSHQCRTQMSALLGSVGAPPLSATLLETTSNYIGSSFTSQQCNENTLKEQSERVIGFTQAHVKLLLAFDRAAETVRVGTGIQLGLGPSSRCVARVERAALGRQHRTKDTHGKATVRVSVTFQRARTLIWRAMVEQRSSLESLLVRLDESIDDSISNEKQPTTITLSMLNSSRKQLQDVLSKVLSILGSPIGLHGLTIVSTLEAALEESAWMAAETKLHVESVLSPAPKKPQTLESRIVFKYLENMHLELEAARVALWAFQDACDTDKNEESGDMHEWFGRVGQHVGNAMDIHQLARDDVLAKFNSDGIDTEKRKGNKRESRAEVNESKEVCPTQYEDLGHDQVSNVPIPLQSSDTLKNKTAVFSGKGSKSQAPARAAEIDYSFAESSAANERDQANLLQELSNRLGVMDLAEEVEMSIEDDIQDAATPAGNATNVESFSGVFLGASGALLAELKFAISKTASE